MLVICYSWYVREIQSLCVQWSARWYCNIISVNGHQACNFLLLLSLNYVRTHHWCFLAQRMLIDCSVYTCVQALYLCIFLELSTSMLLIERQIFCWFFTSCQYVFFACFNSCASINSSHCILMSDSIQELITKVLPLGYLS